MVFDTEELLPGIERSNQFDRRGQVPESRERRSLFIPSCFWTQRVKEQCSGTVLTDSEGVRNRWRIGDNGESGKLCEVFESLSHRLIDGRHFVNRPGAKSSRSLQRTCQ